MPSNKQLLHGVTAFALGAVAFASTKLFDENSASPDSHQANQAALKKAAAELASSQLKPLLDRRLNQSELSDARSLVESFSKNDLHGCLTTLEKHNRLAFIPIAKLEELSKNMDYLSLRKLGGEIENAAYQEALYKLAFSKLPIEPFGKVVEELNSLPLLMQGEVSESLVARIMRDFKTKSGPNPSNLLNCEYGLVPAAFQKAYVEALFKEGPAIAAGSISTILNYKGHFPITAQPGLIAFVENALGDQNVPVDSTLMLIKLFKPGRQSEDFAAQAYAQVLVKAPEDTETVSAILHSLSPQRQIWTIDVAVKSVASPTDALRLISQVTSPENRAALLLNWAGENWAKGAATAFSALSAADKASLDAALDPHSKKQLAGDIRQLLR